MNKLFCDLKTDEEKASFFLSGRGFETGVIAKAIQNDVAMAYQRCAEYRRQIAQLREQQTEPTARAPVAKPIGKVESAVPGASGFHVRLTDGADIPKVGAPLYTAVPSQDDWRIYAKEEESARECIERHRKEQDALLELLKQAAPTQDAEDAARLDWLTFNLGGKALRDIGVIWSEHGDARRAIDAARAQQEKK